MATNRTKATTTTSTLIVFAWLTLATQGFASDLPTVKDLLIEIPFGAEHTTQVLAGEIATTKVVPVSKSELAQGVACLVKNDTLTKVDAVQSATWLAPEHLILSSSQLPDHAVLADFQNIQHNTLYEDEIQQFINAKAGSKLNLSLVEIAQFNQLKTKTSQELQPIAADQLIKKMLLTRYQAYREKGLNALTPYARTKQQEVQPLQQLKTSLEESFGLKTHYPTVYNLLEQYPQAANPAFVEDYFWYMVNLDDRPAIGLSHRLQGSVNQARFIIERGFYISHSLDSVQIVVAIIPAQEGLLLIYINRTWTEKITGFLTGIKQRIGYDIMMSEMEHVMKSLNVCGSTS